MNDHHRLKVLDGFRAVAILLVIGFHYFYRWTPPKSSTNLYPYGDFGAHFWLFQYGYYGVELFFIISGFVISMTLFRCRSIGHFARKRFARLFPTMLLCSLITYVVLSLLPQHAFQPNVRDFLPSLSFTDPLIWTKLFGSHFQAMDGAYWSLFVEVKFYIWIGILYFSVGPQRFFRAVAWFFGALVLVSALHLPHHWGIDFIFVINYLPWFVAGIGFYALYGDHTSRMGWFLLTQAAVAVIVLQLEAPGSAIASLVVLALCYGLFLAMLMRPQWVAWLAYPPIASVGVASYSLYLLHQNIGVAILDTYRKNLGPTPSADSALLVPILVGLMIATSLLIYRYWEAPAKTFLLTTWHSKPASAPRRNRPDDAADSMQ